MWYKNSARRMQSKIYFALLSRSLFSRHLCRKNSANNYRAAAYFHGHEVLPLSRFKVIPKNKEKYTL